MSLAELIEDLQSQGVLRTPKIIAAFKTIDRAKFIPPRLEAQAYQNIPLPIGFGQTISQPLTVAIMLEALQPAEREHVLDVGAGSGWVAALLGILVGARGRVIGVERIPQLAVQAQKNIKDLSLPTISIVTGDASHGWPDGAPYDVIHVAAAAPTLPSEFKHQLAMGGRLIVPVGEPVQDLALITKTGENTWQERRIPGFQFVPLISEK